MTPVSAMSASLTPPPLPRGLHSSTFRLNVSAFCGIGGVFEDCFWIVFGLFRGGEGV